MRGKGSAASEGGGSGGGRSHGFWSQRGVERERFGGRSGGLAGKGRLVCGRCGDDGQAEGTGGGRRVGWVGRPGLGFV